MNLLFAGMGIEVSQNIIALGFFDGVHMGHRQILDHAIALGAEKNLTPCVFTMKNHPRGLTKSKTPLKLTSFSERKNLLRGAGVKEVFAVEFTPEFAAISAEDFAKMLKDEYDCQAVVYGENFKFGNKGSGWGEYGVKIWDRIGIEAHVCPHFDLDGEIVSSSLIRAFVADGQMARANKFLGRAFSVSGSVISGAQKGRQIGFPTINLQARHGYVMPAGGVYFTRVYAGGGEYFGVTNVGVRPTFYDDSHVFIETHILDYSGNLYGSRVIVEFIEKIRDEHKFPGIDALKAQIAVDSDIAREMARQVKE